MLVLDNVFPTSKGGLLIDRKQEGRPSGWPQIKHSWDWVAASNSLSIETVTSLLEGSGSTAIISMQFQQTRNSAVVSRKDTGSLSILLTASWCHNQFLNRIPCLVPFTLLTSTLFVDYAYQHNFFVTIHWRDERGPSVCDRFYYNHWDKKTLSPLIKKTQFGHCWILNRLKFFYLHFKVNMLQRKEKSHFLCQQIVC